MYACYQSIADQFGTTPTKFPFEVEYDLKLRKDSGLKILNSENIIMRRDWIQILSEMSRELLLSRA